jgi:hypothetical protein
MSIKYKMILLALVVSFVWGCGGGGDNNDEQQINITSQDFVGVWNGSVNIEGEDRATKLTFDENLNGAYVIVGSNRTDIHDDIVANFLNQMLYFDLPVSNLDEGNPDCVNWYIKCEATLSGDLSLMDLYCEGIACGSGGGQYIELTDILEKE